MTQNEDLTRRPKPAKAPTVDLHEVERMANLSRLSLTSQEEGRLQRELSSILEYFATLDKIDVSKISSEAAEEGGSLRQDVVMPSEPEAILKGVPQKKGRYVKAPRVF